MDDGVRPVLTELVQSQGEAFYGDAALVESQLRERIGEHTEEVPLLVAAVRAGVVNELLGVKPGLYEVSVGHLASRMVRLYDSDPEGARWAVEAWAQALGAGPPRAPAPAPTSPPVATRTPPPPPAPEPKVRSRLTIPWPRVTAGGAGVVGLVALIVLLRMIVGLVHSSGGGGDASRPPAPSTTLTATTLATPAAQLVVPPGLTLGTGDVQVTLLWADGNDLDLHVIDPSGAEIYFSHPTSPTGGTLDHDDTAGCSSTGTHAENVFWSTGRAPAGRYRVFVKNYTSCGSPSQYSLQAKVRGRAVITTTGTVGAHEGDQSPVSEFSF
ncbi:MAG TPA: hypothetical protein VG076_02900 [Acidimicrobiales bacterium]|nr:hypothetical protein [Acidimicrobiales bacterium]